MKQYDAIIIGFGKGGKLLAAELAERNWKVAIVERSPQMYGGTCVNVGCIPTKTLIHESEYAEKRYYDDYKNQSKLYALAVARKDKLVSFLCEKNYENVKNKPNITLYDGTASFLSENTIRIVSGKDETILEGKEIFINTGSTPILPAIDGLKESKYVREFGIKKAFKKLVISLIICTFIGDNQQVTNKVKAMITKDKV
ncbi:FAD-dependent oxidoreductase, partial [Bacteroides uniformis]